MDKEQRLGDNSLESWDTCWCSMAMTTTLLLVVAVIITLFLVVVVVIIMTVLRTKDATVHKPIPVSDEGRQGTARAVSLTVPSRGQQRFNLT